MVDLNVRTFKERVQGKAWLGLSTLVSSNDSLGFHDVASGFKYGVLTIVHKHLATKWIKNPYTTYKTPIHQW